MTTCCPQYWKVAHSSGTVDTMRVSLQLIEHDTIGAALLLTIDSDVRAVLTPDQAKRFLQQLADAVQAVEDLDRTLKVQLN